MSPKTEIRGLDIWEIEIQVAEGGMIKRVSEVTETSKSGKESKKMMKKALTIGVDNSGNDIVKKLWKRKLVNYASIGFGARVGLGFDAKRTKSRLCNKLMYGWEGAKKVICKGGGPTMQNLIEKFELVVDAKPNKQAILGDLADTDEVNTNQFNQAQALAQGQDEKVNLADNVEFKQIGQWDVKGETVFQAKKSQTLMLQPDQPIVNSSKLDSKDKKENILMINPINLVMLNVNSYAGGIQNMWDKASSSTTKSSIKGASVNHSKLSPFDGKLEFLSFKNRYYFGLCERACTGGGMRIEQGKHLT